MRRQRGQSERASDAAPSGACAASCVESGHVTTFRRRSASSRSRRWMRLPISSRSLSDEVGDSPPLPRRPRRLRLADPPLPRPGGGVRVRRRPGRGAGRCDAVRHARRRALPPRRRLQLRDLPAPLRARRSGAVGDRQGRARGRPRRRALRRTRGARTRRLAAWAIDGARRRSVARALGTALRRPLRVPQARASDRPGAGVSGLARAERAELELRSARTMRRLFLYFLRLGSFGFGGPIALAGYMRRDLVDARGWYSDDEYQQGLAIAQTMPGPLAAQLAMWLGYLERGARGALLVALPFVVPPFLLVTAVAALYAHYQGLSQVESVFFGVGPAVMAIIAIAAYKLARSTNKHDLLLWSIAAIVCASTVISGSEIVWLFLAAGLFGALYYGGGLPRPRDSAASLVPLPLATVKGFAWLAAGGSLGTLGLFFAKASALTFGSGLAVVPFLHQGLVTDHHWLTERQLTDAVAMGLISPGPVVIMGTFAGYLVAGVVGAAVATVALFAPTYLFVVVPGRLFRRFERHPRLQGFVKGATAAAAGAIAGAAIVIGRQTIHSWLSAAIGVLALALLLQKRIKVPEPALVAAAAVAGLALH